MPSHEPRARQDRGNRAATILDDDADAGVIEDDIAGDEQETKDRIGADSDREPRSLDGQVACQPAIGVGEDPAVNQSKEDRVNDPGDRAQPEQPPEMHATGGEKAMRACAASPRKAIDDPSG